MIITLAGHVDHGKTSLVRALTGVDTDRLAEEKARGLTIDLGFAYTEHLGFVDVPGHQKFIHNMVAGVASHQHALLVIAADDGPMPQTAEHLEILTLLGVTTGTIALTKCDLVDSQRLSRCRDEIAALMRGTFLQDAPLFETSPQGSAGYQALNDHLHEIAAAEQTLIDESSFRLAVDRAFTVKGAGVVVTGTVHCGAVAVDQQVTHFPSGKTLRVRSIRAQDQTADRAYSGNRCALNLVGTSLDELKRGDWVTAKPAAGNRSVTIRLDQAASFPRGLKHWMPVHVYHATSHSTGRLAIFTDAPDDEVWAEVVCDDALACYRGDRIVLRDQALDATLGGGEVLYVRAEQARRRNTVEHQTLVAAYAVPSMEQSFDQLMAAGELRLEEFGHIWNVPEAGLNALKQQQKLVALDDVVVSENQWQTLKDTCLREIAAAPPKQTLQGQPALHAQELVNIPRSLRQPTLNALLKSGDIEQKTGHYLLPNKKASLAPELAELWAKLEPLLDQIQAPSSGDLAKQLNRPLAGLEKQMFALAKERLLTHIGTHRFYLPQRLLEVADAVQSMADSSANGSITVKAFRDQTGIGRNVAIEVLEYFDGRGFTKRQGNDRVILRPFDEC
jgi:selenocysteine-specific elongation factor